VLDWAELGLAGLGWAGLSWVGRAGLSWADSGGSNRPMALVEN